MIYTHNLAIVFVFIGLLCGALGLAGWAAQCFGDALTAEFNEEQENGKDKPPSN